MNLSFVRHEKISLKKHAVLNERWLQDRIIEDPSILGLGADLRVLASERSLPGGGRLDLILKDDVNDRRYEVELQLGPTDPSHIIRCIEYWDLERRRYPAYEHIAVLVAEDVTARFLNVISLMAGSIPIMAIQLDALRLDEKILLHFTHVLDQSELRRDDETEESGGNKVDREHWDKKAGKALMKLSDGILELVNQSTKSKWELTYLQGYIGLQSNGLVNNFIHMGPRSTKKFAHVYFKNSNADDWVKRFEGTGLEVRSKVKGRFRLTLNPEELNQNRELIAEAVADTVKELEV